jgi:hypothetical protein
VRREVFFFASGGEHLYGSLYASTRPRRPYGLVLCSSWGIDADRLKRLLSSLGLEMARMGGVGVLFDFPGYGDSSGVSEVVAIDDLVAATLGVAAEAAQRYPGTTWIFGGALLGASVAALGARAAGAHHLLLLQPELDPASYVRLVVKKARRRTLGVGDSDKSAFGYPVPQKLLDGHDAAVVSVSLERFEGRGAVIRYSEPPLSHPIREDFEVTSVPGTWTVAQKTYPELVGPALKWLDRVTRP